MKKKKFNFTILFVSTLWAITAARCTSGSQDYEDIAKTAFGYTEKMLEFGPRPPGSEGLRNVRSWLIAEASRLGFSLTEHSFSAQTPLGSVDMANLSLVIPGVKRDHAVLLVGHYDSKKIDTFTFLGAGDAASSVALLLALAEPIKKQRLPFDVEVVFVDGEEALVSWTPSDSLYGSRHLAQSIQDISKIKAAMVVDMISDPSLKFIRSHRSDPELVNKMEKTLQDMGRSDTLDAETMFVEDDHIPLANLGIPVLHIMDFTYGGSSSPGTYWHTSEDTLDKVSVPSLSLTAQVILGVLKLL